MKRFCVYILALLGLILAGCSGTTDGNIDTEYTVDGILFHNPGDNTSFCYALIFQDGEEIQTLLAYVITGAEDSVQLTPIGNGAYQTGAGSLILIQDSSYYIRADDAFGDFYFSHSLSIADTFRVEITNLNPDRTYVSGNVNISWNAPSQDFGYFVTVVPPSSEAVPYSSFETDYVEAEAFQNSAGDKVLGKYKIYIVAYDETFYSNGNLEPNLIFFPYPATGFPDNIDRPGVSGKFGAATMSYHDSVIVIANP
jgi:hypothetical protein